MFFMDSNNSNINLSYIKLTCSHHSNTSCLTCLHKVIKGHFSLLVY